VTLATNLQREDASRSARRVGVSLTLRLVAPPLRGLFPGLFTLIERDVAVCDCRLLPRRYEGWPVGEERGVDRLI
jgi:hypothetical protein